MLANADSQLAPVRRALVVEDHEQTAYLLEFLLDRAGFDVAVARSGREAQDRLAAEGTLDVVLFLVAVLENFGGHSVVRRVNISL